MKAQLNKFYVEDILKILDLPIVNMSLVWFYTDGYLVISEDNTTPESQSNNANNTNLFL